MKEDFVVNPFMLKLSGIEIHFRATRKSRCRSRRQATISLSSGYIRTLFLRYPLPSVSVITYIATYYLLCTIYYILHICTCVHIYKPSYQARTPVIAFTCHLWR